MKQKPYIFAVSGVKNSGKTTLITKLVAVFTSKGLKTAVIKHSGHGFDADIPGTDSCRYAASGAYGTAVFSGDKFMVVKQTPQPSMEHLLSFFPDADLIILEGMKHSSFPKIEIVRSGNSSTPVCEDSSLNAIATDMQGEELETLLFALEHRKDRIDCCKLLNLNDAEAIADFILENK